MQGELMVVKKRQYELTQLYSTSLDQQPDEIQGKFYQSKEVSSNQLQTSSNF
jgi:hypothetical protein